MLTIKQNFSILSNLLIAYLFSGKIPSADSCLPFLNPYQKQKPLKEEDHDFPEVKALLESSNRSTRSGFSRLLVLFVTRGRYFDLHSEVCPLESNVLKAMKEFLANSNFVILCRPFAHLLLENLVSKAEVLLLKL